MDHAGGPQGGPAQDATGVSEGAGVKKAGTAPKFDIFDDHYRRLRDDPVLRQRLIDNPTEGLREHFGAVPGEGGKCRVEIIAQDPDTIVILLPAPPEKADKSVDINSVIDAASCRIYDILFNSGVGGYLIPSTSMTWVLRDFRSRVAEMLPWPGTK